jgi:hypothetical protein
MVGEPLRLPAGITWLIRVAAGIGLLALALMAVSVFYPAPATVLGAMMVGQTLGAVALACYLLAVWRDMVRVSRIARTSRPPARQSSAPQSSASGESRGPRPTSGGK